MSNYNSNEHVEEEYSHDGEEYCIQSSEGRKCCLPVEGICFSNSNQKAGEHSLIQCTYILFCLPKDQMGDQTKYGSVDKEDGDEEYNVNHCTLDYFIKHREFRTEFKITHED